MRLITERGYVVKFWKPHAIVAVILAGAAMPVDAHTSYMLPNLFTANLEEFVTVESSFTEDFSRPEVAVESDDFHVILPDGKRAEFLTNSKHRQLVVLESPLEQEGTYRFTTGVRRGRVSQRVLVDGKWKSLRETNGEAPANATKVKTSQTETVADVYVTKKAPTRAPVDHRIGRLVIHPKTHPSDAYLGEAFEFEILFDGEPLAGQSVVIDRAGARYDEAKFHQEIETDAQGAVSLKLDRPGTYLVMARRRTAAPAGADTDERSYTTSLTFEVQR